MVTVSFHKSGSSCHSLSNVIHEIAVSVAFFSEISDGHTACANNLTRKTIFVNLAQASPFSQGLVVCDINERNILFGTKPLYQFLVCGLVARFREKDDLCLRSIDIFGNLVQAADCPM